MDVFDCTNTEESRLVAKVQPLNYASIAKACETDPETIELIIKEIVCQLKQFVRNGASVRLAMKIGKLICKNRVIGWKTNGRDDESKYGALSPLLQSTEIFSSIGASTQCPSNIMVGSVKKKDLSVITP